MGRRLREVEETYDDKLRFIDDKLNSLNLKSKELEDQVQNSKVQASAAQSQASRAVGVNPESEAQDKKMKQALAAKSRSDMKYYQDELQKLKSEIGMNNKHFEDKLKQKISKILNDEEFL